ncbi:uncharacterized protein LOC144917362 [Branchiostoma floridae x Branchiostoma belcheri]
MAEILLEGEAPSENMTGSADMTPTKQQTCGIGVSVVSFQRSPKDAEEVVDLLLRELIPQEDWDAASDADSDSPVLTEEGLSRISSSAKADTLDSDISGHVTAKGADPVKPSSGKDVSQAQQGQEGNDDVLSVLKDLDQCLGESSSTEPSVLGTYVTEDNCDTCSVLSDITAYLSEDDNQRKELQQDKGSKESLVTNDDEKTELLVRNGIHEDFDGTTMLVDEEQGKAEDALEVCISTDKEPAVVERCCSSGTRTDETRIEPQENGTKCSMPKDVSTKNSQPSHMITDCAMAVSNKPTNYVDDVIIDLCVTPEEEIDLVDQDGKYLTDSLEGDSMETDAQFEVIDVWPNPAYSCETPPKSLASSPIVGSKGSSTPEISSLSDHKGAIDKSNQSRELNRAVASATTGLEASSLVNTSEKVKVGEIRRKAVPTENSSVSGSVYRPKEVSVKTPQAEQVSDVADKLQSSQDKSRNPQPVVSMSRCTKDCGSENSGRSVVHKSSSSKSKAQSTRPPTSGDCDVEFLQQNKRVKSGPNPEGTVKSHTERPKPKIKPIVWDRSPAHSSKTRNPVVFPAQKTVVIKSEGKQAFVAPTAKNTVVKKMEMPKPQKKMAIKKIVWDRSPARQKDTSKRSPLKDGDLEICIPNKTEAVKEDVRLVYDPQRPLSPDSKNKLLEHLLKVEDSQETETEEIHPSKLKVTISKSDSKVTVAESDPDVPCKKLKLAGERGSHTLTFVADKHKGKAMSAAAKSSSRSGQHKSSKREKHKTHKHSNHEERLVMLKGDPKPTVQASMTAHNSKEKPQHKGDGKEKSTSVEKKLSPDATKRKRSSKRRKKSSDSNDSKDGQGKSRKKAKVSNDIEDELSSLLEITPMEGKVSRPMFSEKLQQEAQPSSDPREACIQKDTVDTGGGSEILETGPSTEVTDLSEKLRRSRAKRQQQQKTSDTVVGMEPTEAQQVHLPDSEICKEDKSQHDMEDMITDEQNTEETQETQEVSITRQVVITDDHISSIAPMKTSTIDSEEDWDAILDLTDNETDPGIQITSPGQSSDLKTTFQSILDEEDFYNENAEALHLENPMEEIIAQERLMYNDTNTIATSTSAALEGEDHVTSDNLSGYETVDEVVDSDNEVQVGGSGSQARQTTTVSSPSVKASFIILPCQNQSPTVLKTTDSISSSISVFVKDTKQNDSEEMKACESTIVKEAALSGFTGTSDIVSNEAAKVDSGFVLPEHAGVTHEESEKVPSQIDLEVTVSKDTSEGEPRGTDSKDLPLTATSTDVLCDEPEEPVCRDSLQNDLGHNLRELLEKALFEALIQSDKKGAEKKPLEKCNNPMALESSHSETSQNQISPSLKEEVETSMQNREQKSDATSGAGEQSQMSSSKEKDAPCEDISESADPGASISSNTISDDTKDPVECGATVKLPPVGNEKIAQVGMSLTSQAITEINPAVVLEACIGNQAQDAVKPVEHKDSADAAIAKEEQRASESKPEEDQNTSEPLKSSIVKSDMPAADIRVVQNSCSKETPAAITSLTTSARVEDKPKPCTDTTTVFTRLENSPQKKSESGVFNRLGGYSTKLKGKKSRAECCTKPRFHPYQGKAPTDSKGQGNENNIHLCKESLEELNQLVTKEDKQAGSKKRKKQRKKQRKPGPSRLYNELQDRLQREGHDIRETYYLDGGSENPYDEGRFTGRGSDPEYCLEEMPCVRNSDPSDMTSKTYRFKATIKVKFPKRDKDFHCYPAPQLPRFKDIPDKFPRHQMKKKEKK